MEEDQRQVRDPAPAFCLILLNVIVLIMTTVPWFIIDVDDNFQIKCFFDRFKFTGDYVKNICDREGKDDSGCDWKGWPSTGRADCSESPYGEASHRREGGNCRMFFKNVEGKEECIPAGFRPKLREHDWYNPDGRFITGYEPGDDKYVPGDEPCNVSFERRAGKGAIAMAILGLFFTLCIPCALQIHEAFYVAFAPIGLCMTGLLVCVIPFGQDNICGREGRNTNHRALICLASLSAFCCFFASIIPCIQRLRRVRIPRPSRCIPMNAEPAVVCD